jgi:hypothetical protein
MKCADNFRAAEGRREGLEAWAIDSFKMHENGKRVYDVP